MKKRILFVLPSYEIGGTTKSLYSLLSMIDPERLDVDVFATHNTGPYKGKMPNCIELPMNIWLSYPYVGGNFFIISFQTIVYGIRFFLSKIHINSLPLIHWIGGKSLQTEKYDAVVSFSEGLAYTVSAFPAKKLIQWIHCDYKRHLEWNNSSFERYAYRRYDKIVCVSEFAKRVFDEIFPEFSNKSIAIHNVINVEDIVAKSKDDSDLDSRFDSNQFTIVSVGRLDPVKQFILIPEIVAKLKKLSDRDFKWYIIGGGFPEEREKIEIKIRNFGLHENIYLLGQKTNVYPYIMRADLYVNTSISEAYSIVNNEAKALQIPVVTNNFECVYETIINNIDGVIIPIENMAEEIATIINTNKTYMITSIDNQEALRKIYNLFI
jgi:glycosyltransferase involved in cell wall biosynthesis